jgi:hypothetical protein
LPKEHWFWDRRRSGGIFIEHGVHFFDMFAGWLGKGVVISAQRTRRPGGDIEEQVNCTVRYPNGALVNFYHGFTQPSRLDRQEVRLLFERGDITLEEWVPTHGRILAAVDETSTRQLVELFPNAKLDITNVYAGEQRAAFGRHKKLDLYQKVQISFGAGTDKMIRYGELLRSVFRDQFKWICDRNHQRILTEENGRESLAMAIQATVLADAQETRQ